MTKWECKLRTEDMLCGKIPNDLEALKHVILNRAKKEKKPKSSKEAEDEAKEEVEEVAESMVNTFYADDKGLFIKQIDIIGMLKERARQMGITIKKKGYIGGLEGLRIEPQRMYLKRNGKVLKKVEGQVPKPIHKAWGKPTINISDYVNEGVEIDFTVEKDTLSFPDKEFEQLLKSCCRLGGLRKEYGYFKWKKVKKLGKKKD